MVIHQNFVLFIIILSVFRQKVVGKNVDKIVIFDETSISKVWSKFRFWCNLNSVMNYLDCAVSRSPQSLLKRTLINRQPIFTDCEIKIKKRNLHKNDLIWWKTLLHEAWGSFFEKMFQNITPGIYLNENSHNHKLINIMKNQRWQQGFNEKLILLTSYSTDNYESHI